MTPRARKSLTAILCMFAVMAAAVLVRLPAARLSAFSDETRQAYIGENGLPYLTEPDSYYHVRITENYLRSGSIGDSFTEDGTAWDSHSFYPEGRSAEYQPGIVLLTAGVWRVLSLFGASLEGVEFWLATAMSALAALAAFLLGSRMSGTAGGFAAGLFVSCAPSFVARTLPGRYDTDMFVVLMNVLMLLLLTEALRGRTRSARIAASAGFGVTVLVYSACWSVYAFMFAAVTILGGLIYVLALFFAPPEPGGKGGRLGQFARRPALRALLLSTALTVILVVLVNGPEFLVRFARTTASAHDITASAALPNLFASVSELRVPSFLPASVTQWFSSYVPGQRQTVVAGVGGGAVVLLCVGGLAALIVRAARPGAGGNMPRRSECVMYACLLGLWLLGGLYAVRLGVRFIEHLAVPVGVLAGACVGWIAPEPGDGPGYARLGRSALAVLLCAAAAASPVIGSAVQSRNNRPAVTDATAQAMGWIRENAADPDAVIASWWDLGYYYESESGHPALWDGGCQNGARAILVARALAGRDPALSRDIFAMLSHAGNRPIELLMEHTDAASAYDALWAALPMESGQARSHLADSCGLSAAEAAEVEAMLHPDAPRETYVIVSGDMLNKLGWLEYYSDWDFTGAAPTPDRTRYSVMPHTGATQDSDDARAQAFFAARAEETIWRLYFDGDGAGCFRPVYEANDGVERVQVWRVEP